MKIWGVEQSQVEMIAASLDMHTSNERKDGRAFAFKLDADGSRSKYARRSSPSFDGKPGRRLTSLCYHGWRDFIRALFAAGATRVQTTQGNWINVADFDADLSRLAQINIGSLMYPFQFIEACEDKHFDDPDTFDNTHDADCAYWQGAIESLDGCTCNPQGVSRDAEATS